MLQHSHPPSDDTATIVVLNRPRPAEVEADGHALPRVLVRSGRRLRVAAIQDVWRIDDEWWRAPIARRYFLVTLEEGSVRTIFHDLLSGAWFEQSY
jgi:hypothetical protein